MNVKNSKCIRNLAVQSLKKSYKRNIIAVAAMALTTLLFTGVFSVVFSLSATFDAYNSRINGLSEGLPSLLSFEGILIVAAFVLILGFSGYLIIYNIFQISVVNDVSYYGLLKTTGVTGKQLRRIINIQALVLSAIGIPFGLLGGYFVGVITTPIITRISNMSDADVVNSVSPWIFVVAIVVTLITVFISCSKPGRVASEISPIEAFRYNEVKVDNVSSKKNSGLLGMAVKNLSRNKKKTILVVLSMALPIVILALGFGLSNGISFEKYYTAGYAFHVSNSDYFNYVIPDSDNGKVDDFISDEDVENMVSHINFSKYGSAYTTDRIPECNGYLAQVFGFDKDLFEDVEVIEGDLAPLFAPDSNAIAVSVSNSETPTQVKVGDRITIDYESGKYSKEYEVCAFVDYSEDYWILFSFDNSYEFVMTSDQLKRESKDQMHRYVSVFDTLDKNEVMKAEDYISDYCIKNNLQYSSETTERKEFMDFENMFRDITIILCVVLALIGIMNYINAVLTGILTRSHELAVLKAIGMTDKQQKRMLITEGILYTAGSVVGGSILYLCMHPLLVAFFDGLDYITPILSFIPIILIAMVFLFFGVLIPYVVYGLLAKKTVVERLRVNE